MVPELEGDLKKMNLFFVEIQSSKVLLLILAFIVFSLLVLIIPDGIDNIKVALATFGVTAGWALMPNWFVQGIRRMSDLVWINIIPKAIFLGLVFLTIKSKEDSYLYPLFISLSTIICALLSITYLKFKLKVSSRIRFNKSVFIRIWQERLVFLSSFVNNFNQTIGIIFLGFFVTYSEVGVFSLGWRMMNIIQVLVSIPILQSLYPVLGSQLRSDLRSGTKVLNESIPLILVFIFSCSSLLWGTSSWLIHFFFGEEFIESARIYRWLSIIPLISVFNHLMGSSFLLNLGYDKEVLRVTIWVSILAISLNLFLIWNYGLDGAIISIIITELILFLFYNAVIKKLGFNFWRFSAWKFKVPQVKKNIGA
jgi:PST family polysaccharide transporter